MLVRLGSGALWEDRAGLPGARAGSTRRGSRWLAERAAAGGRRRQRRLGRPGRARPGARHAARARAPARARGHPHHRVAQPRGARARRRARVRVRLPAPEAARRHRVPGPPASRWCSVARMARTHYFPEDRVHFTWDAGHEPVLTIDAGDTVVVRHARRERQPDRARLRRERDPRASTGTASTRSPARSRSTAPSRATRSRSRSSTSTREGWGWTAILPGLGLLADDFPDAYLRIFDISAGDVRALPRRRRDPARRRSSGRWASARPARARSRSCRPGTFGGNMDTRQLVAGHHALPAGPGRRRAVLHRRRARLPGRRRGLRDRPRGADVRDAALHAREGPRAPVAAVPHRARPADAAGRPRRVVRHHRRRRRPLRRRAGRHPRDDRPRQPSTYALARGRLPAVLACAST